MILTEGDLEFDFTGAIQAFKFDDRSTHQLSAFKAVDFVAEYGNRLYLIEVKDPENRIMDPERLKEVALEMAGKMNEDMYLNSLGRKCRDSFLYHLLLDRIPAKEIHYVVLVAFEDASKRSLETMTRKLKELTGLAGPDGQGWRKPYLHRVAAVDLNRWPKLIPEVKVSRV